MRCLLAWFLIIALGCTSVPKAEAVEFLLPKANQIVHLSAPSQPPLLKGITVNPQNPFQLNFILQKGKIGDPALKAESHRLVEYFLASLTTPEKDLWVNLSPYEKNRIIPISFGQTQMGRDLLAEDYLLKQITSSLMYPEEDLGHTFWQEIYKVAKDKFNTTQIPVNTFNKVWIVPDQTRIYEHNNTAYITKATLKVMLEEDFFSSTQGKERAFIQRSSFSQIIRKVVIPKLEQEVNQGQNFAVLRQIYYSLILATWYKQKMRNGILGESYVNQNKIRGIKDQGKIDPQMIYQQYLEAFRKGVYNYIREERDPTTQQLIPRKYFSGGWKGKIDLKYDHVPLKEDVDQPNDIAMLSVKLSNIPISRRKFIVSGLSAAAVGVGAYQFLKPRKTPTLYLMGNLHPGPVINDIGAILTVHMPQPNLYKTFVQNVLEGDAGKALVTSLRLEAAQLKEMVQINPNLIIAIENEGDAGEDLSYQWLKPIQNAHSTLLALGLSEQNIDDLLLIFFGAPSYLKYYSSEFKNKKINTVLIGNHALFVKDWEAKEQFESKLRDLSVYMPKTIKEIRDYQERQTIDHSLRPLNPKDLEKLFEKSKDEIVRLGLRELKPAIDVLVFKTVQIYGEYLEIIRQRDEQYALDVQKLIKSKREDVVVILGRNHTFEDGHLYKRLLELQNKKWQTKRIELTSKPSDHAMLVSRRAFMASVLGATGFGIGSLQGDQWPFEPNSILLWGHHHGDVSSIKDFVYNREMVPLLAQNKKEELLRENDYLVNLYRKELVQLKKDLEKDPNSIIALETLTYPNEKYIKRIESNLEYYKAFGFSEREIDDFKLLDFGPAGYLKFFDPAYKNIHIEYIGERYYFDKERVALAKIGTLFDELEKFIPDTVRALNLELKARTKDPQSHNLTVEELSVIFEKRHKELIERHKEDKKDLVEYMVSQVLAYHKQRLECSRKRDFLYVKKVRNLALKYHRNIILKLGKWHFNAIDDVYKKLEREPEKWKVERRQFSFGDLFKPPDQAMLTSRRKFVIGMGSAVAGAVGIGVFHSFHPEAAKKVWLVGSVHTFPEAFQYAQNLLSIRIPKDRLKIGGEAFFKDETIALMLKRFHQELEEIKLMLNESPKSIIAVEEPNADVDNDSKSIKGINDNYRIYLESGLSKEQIEDLILLYFGPVKFLKFFNVDYRSKFSIIPLGNAELMNAQASKIKEISNYLLELNKFIPDTVDAYNKEERKRVQDPNAAPMSREELLNILDKRHEEIVRRDLKAKEGEIEVWVNLIIKAYTEMLDIVRQRDEQYALEVQKLIRHQRKNVILILGKHHAYKDSYLHKRLLELQGQQWKTEQKTISLNRKDSAFEMAQAPGGIDFTPRRLNVDVQKDKAQDVLINRSFVSVEGLVIDSLDLKPIHNLPEILGIVN